MAAAMEKYGEAAILEMFIDMLPKYAREIAQPLSKIEQMKVIDLGGSDSSGSTKITSNVTKTMIGLQESLKEATGMDLKSMLESFVSRGNVQHYHHQAEGAVSTEQKIDDKPENPKSEIEPSEKKEN